MSVYAIMYTVCLQATLLHYLGSHGYIIWVHMDYFMVLFLLRIQYSITRDFNIASVQRTRPLPYHISLSYLRHYMVLITYTKT